MRQITVKYAGECRECAAELPAGVPAIYERKVGLFCPACAPTDPEKIREYRTEAAERKAERLEGWAEKREAKAEAALNSHPEIRRDWAFITQPGRIPLRERMNRADDRAFESLAKARHMRGRAAGLRAGVRVAGDAERKRQPARDFAALWLRKGIKVDCLYGVCEVVRVNAKSVTVKAASGFTDRLGLDFVSPADDEARAAVRAAADQIKAAE